VVGLTGAAAPRLSRGEVSAFPGSLPAGLWISVRQLIEEAESLEETLNDSIREAVFARSKGAGGDGAKRGGAWTRMRRT